MEVEDEEETRIEIVGDELNYLYFQGYGSF